LLDSLLQETNIIYQNRAFTNKMWKKRFILQAQEDGNNVNGQQSKRFKEEKDDIQGSQDQQQTFSNKTRYRASLKNGVLVEDERGPLIVTHNYYHVYNNNNDGCNLNQESLHSNHDQDYPLDLSTKLLEPKIEAKIESADTTASCPSPCLIDLTVKKNVEPDTSCQTQIERRIPSEIQSMYPHLKMTNTGSLVLWNFLWALLQDANYKKIAIWESVCDLKFRIVDPAKLSQLWGKIKQNQTMDWTKISKILDLYRRKNLIKLCVEGMLVYQFLIVPKHVKQVLLSPSSPGNK